MKAREFINRCGWQLVALSFGIFIGIRHDKVLLSAIGPWLTLIGMLVVGFSTRREGSAPTNG